MGLLTAFVPGLCLLAWATHLSGPPVVSDIFPLLGLMAFVLMALHYIGGSLKRGLGLSGDTRVLALYVRITGYIVLVLILLHPALLYINFWQGGLGLPPASAWAAYPHAAAKAGLIMGSVALTAFLLFELGRWFREKPWWRYIEYASIAGMILIFVHSLILGGDLMIGWFRLVWIVLGWATGCCIIYNVWFDRAQQKV